MSLSCSGLSVGEDGAVVALEDLLHQWSHDTLVDVRLKIEARFDIYPTEIQILKVLISQQELRV